MSDFLPACGLTYPHGEDGPAEGAVVEVAPGICWVRLPVGGSLGHVNAWLIEDEGGVAIVDVGLGTAEMLAIWDGLIAGPLAGRAVTRVIGTHFHPDHIGAAGMLCRRFGAPLEMTRGEWLTGRMLAVDRRDGPPEEAVAQWRLAGWDEERIAAESAKGWGRFASVVTSIPASYRRLRAGDRLSIGARRFTILVGSGHSPEHALLHDEDAGLLIAGDQILPRISSNVSVGVSEPEGDPLGEWMESLDRLRTLPADTLVLPGHGAPFTGLHARIDALLSGHAKKLDRLAAALDSPRRAVDCFATLFRQAVPEGHYGLATGEALAHLHRLEMEGRVRREVKDGVAWFGRTD